MKNNFIFKILALSIIQCAPLFCWDAFIPIIPSLSKIYKVNSTSLSYGISLFAIAYIFMSQISAFYIDKYSPKIIVPLALFLSVIINIFFLFNSDFYFFLILRILLGCFLSVTICCNSIISSIFSAEEKMRALSYLTSLSGVGLAVAPLIGAQLNNYFGYNSIFIFQSFYCAFSLIFFYILNKEFNFTRLKNNSLNFKDIFNLLKNKDLIYSANLRAISYIPHFLFVTFSSILILEVFNLNFNLYSLLMFLLGTSCIIGGFFSNYIFSKIGISNATILGAIFLLGGSIFSMFILIAKSYFYIYMILILFVVLISLGRSLLSPFLSKIIIVKCSSSISSASSMSMIYVYFISSIFSSLISIIGYIHYSIFIISLFFSLLLILLIISNQKRISDKYFDVEK